MKDYEDEAFDELEKSLQRKVSHGVTDGSLWRKRNITQEEVIALANEVSEEAWSGGIDWRWDELETYTKLALKKWGDNNNT
jgi:hypothetical protein